MKETAGSGFINQRSSGKQYGEASLRYLWSLFITAYPLPHAIQGRSSGKTFTCIIKGLGYWSVPWEASFNVEPYCAATAVSAGWRWLQTKRRLMVSVCEDKCQSFRNPLKPLQTYSQNFIERWITKTSLSARLRALGTLRDLFIPQGDYL